MAWPGFRNLERCFFVCSLSLLLMGAVIPASGADSAQDEVEPLWPLDLPTRYLTSNFMEYRSGRFHAGLDLKTQSKIGFAARAAENGSVVRVRATPFAYGRAIYLLGDSGRTYVYAHLSRFNDAIRSEVRSVQAESGNYRTRLQFAPGRMRVSRGQVLGLTGESGTGGPHLHFEVRDPDNGPVNPLARGFSVPDKLPPVIHAVRAVPADARSRIDGGPNARVLKSGDGSGLSGALGEIQIAGAVAFAAKIIDASDVAGHKLEPWLVEVRLDGKLVYRCRNDRYEFSQNSLQRLEWLEVPGIRDRWLHVRPGNSLDGREGGEWFRGASGTGLEPGRHDLVIEASDFAGNMSRVDIPLLVADVDFPQPPTSGIWTEDPVVVTRDSLPENDLHPFVEVNNENSTWDGSLLFSPENGDPVLSSVMLVRQDRISNKEFTSQMRRQGLSGGDSLREYLAADWPIDAALVVPAPLGAQSLVDSLPPEKDPALMVYRWSGKKWSPAGRLMEPSGTYSSFRFALSNPGLFGVFRDVAAPVIFPADTVISVREDPRGESHGVTLSRWEVFPVSMVDQGAGIAPESISATLDGLPLVVEPDLPRKRVLVELPDGLAPGIHVLHLKVSDEAKNEAEKVISIECFE